MKINANIPAFITNKQLLRIESNLATSMERLSSGLKINRAKDNPAGMATSNKMRAQIAALDRASNNASDAIAAIRIAEGALNEASSIMQRMRELAVQAANDTNGLEDRQAIQDEIDALKEEINRISRDTEYNEMPILDGSLCSRVYGDHVDRLSTTDAVNAGMYRLTVDEAAEQAVAAGGATNAADPDGTAVAGVEGSVSVNGYSVEIAATDTAAEVYEKLREAAEVGGASLERDANGGLVFKTKAYGQEAALTVGFSSETFAADLGFTGLVENPDTGVWETPLTTGKDAQIILEKNTDNSAFSDTATVRAEGNRVIITDKGGFEMSFLLNEDFDKTNDPDIAAGADGAGVIDLEVTDIGTMTIHIGANMNQNMIISVPEISSESLYIDDIDVTTMGGAGAAITRLDEAIKAVSSARSKLGAYENRLEYSVSSLDAFEENMTEAESRLADTDMAQEMTTYTQQNVLNQAAISVLTQANDMPQQVLQLLQ